MNICSICEMELRGEERDLFVVEYNIRQLYLQD